MPLSSIQLPINSEQCTTSLTSLGQNSGCSGGCSCSGSGGVTHRLQVWARIAAVVVAVVALVASQRYAPHYGGGWPLCRAGPATSYADTTAPPPFTILFYSPLLVLSASWAHFVSSLPSFHRFLEKKVSLRKAWPILGAPLASGGAVYVV